MNDVYSRYVLHVVLIDYSFFKYFLDVVDKYFLTVFSNYKAYYYLLSVLIKNIDVPVCNKILAHN